MISLALIAVASATEPNTTPELDRLIEATPSVEMVLAGPTLPVESTDTIANTAAPETTAPPQTAESETVQQPPSQSLQTASEGTPIDWSDNGSHSVLESSSGNIAKGSASGISLVMVPLALGLMGLVVFLRKRVFTQLPTAPKEATMNIVGRKATGNQSAVFLIDVADLEGGTRRLLIGSSPAGNNLIADISPTDAIFPEPVFEDDRAPSPEPSFASKSDFSMRKERLELRAVEPRVSAAEELLDFGPKRALIDELLSSSEKSSFRPRSVKQAYADSHSQSNDPNSEEKRRAAQAVLDEVLAERRNGHRGTQVRVTA